MKVLVAITGASGAIFGIDLLKHLKDTDATVHLILSPWGEETIRYETSWAVDDVKALADEVFDVDNMFAPPASGSSHYDAMVIAPCSMKTLAAIRTDYAENLIVRAASTMLKERRKLVLVVRETPLSIIQLQNMYEVGMAGATIMPPVPAMYRRPETLQDMVSDFSLRVIDHLGLEAKGFVPWSDLA